MLCQKLQGDTPLQMKYVGVVNYIESIVEIPYRLE